MHNKQKKLTFILPANEKATVQHLDTPPTFEKPKFTRGECFRR